MTREARARLDDLLEVFVAELASLLDPPAFDARIVAAASGGWRAEAWIDPATFALDLVPPGPGARDELDDYQLALLYGLGFDDDGPDDAPLFRQEFDYEEGEEWEEQALRELGLLALAALRDVLHQADVASYRVERWPNPDRT